MRTCTVLRDLSRPVTTEPYEARPGTRIDAPSELRVERAMLNKLDIRDISRDPQVRAIAPVMPTTLIHPIEVQQQATHAWGIAAVGADTTTRTGAGVPIAVLDTGIDSTHAAFNGVSLVEHDFSGSGNGDKVGHGTHCAGTILGRDTDGIRIGVARGVQRALIAKVLDDTGHGDTDMLFRGLQWAVQEGARVISMSLGFDFPGMVQRLSDSGWPVDLATSAGLEAYRANLHMFDALMAMIETRDAFGAGLLVTAAAGNESHREIHPDYEIAASLPAAAQDVISVGALAQSSDGLNIANFSNTFPQVSAPGVDVLSARLGGGLRSLNGTSMATPHVAGVAALWWEEILDSPLPPTSATVTAKLLASAATSPLAPGLDVSDRGVGIVRAP